MYCRKCGNLLNVEDKFCNKCGFPVELNTNTETQTPGNNIQPESISASFSSQSNTNQQLGDNVEMLQDFHTINNPNESKDSLNPKSSNKLFAIIVTIFGIIIIALTCFLLFGGTSSNNKPNNIGNTPVSNKDDNSESKDKKDNSVIKDNSESDNINNKDNNSESKDKKDNSVIKDNSESDNINNKEIYSYNGVNISIPNGCNKRIDKNVLVIYNDNNEQIELNVSPKDSSVSDFDYINSAALEYRKMMIDLGYSNVDLKRDKLGNYEYFLISFVEDGTNISILSILTKNYEFLLGAYGMYNEKFLNYVDTIISEADNSSASSFSKTEKMDSTFEDFLNRLGDKNEQK